MEETEVVTMRESMCAHLYSRNKDPESVWEQEAVCSRSQSELHPPTASRPSSQGLTQEERAGMRKWLKAQIYTLCRLLESTTSPPLCLIWEALQCWACNLWSITSPPVAFTRTKKKKRKRKKVIQKVMISWTFGMALNYVRPYASFSSCLTQNQTVWVL